MTALSNTTASRSKGSTTGGGLITTAARTPAEFRTFSTTAFSSRARPWSFRSTLQAYAGHSRIFGEYGDPWDARLGTNWFPFNNHVIRWNTEALYLYKSPVGYSSVPFVVGGKGWVFHSTVEMAF